MQRRLAIRKVDMERLAEAKAHIVLCYRGGTTEVVPCYKTPEFNIPRCVFSIWAETN
jgi:hypothetical protein